MSSITPPPCPAAPPRFHGLHRVPIQQALDFLAGGRLGRAAEPGFEFEAVELRRIVAGGDHHAASGILAFTAKETAGVGVGSEVSVTEKPLPAKISAVRRPNSLERNRRS